MYTGQGLTNYERAIITVLSTIMARQIFPGHEKSTSRDDFYALFDEDMFRLKSCLGGASIGELLEAIRKEGYLEDSGEGYALTAKGISHLRELLLAANRQDVLRQNAFVITRDAVPSRR